MPKILPLDHVMYKLYGGNWREAAQINRLNTPYQASYGDSLFHTKEALPYNLYYESFAPTSLPAGISTQWTQYYPGTTDRIRVILEGGSIEDTIMFARPPPPNLKKREPGDGIAIAILFILGLIGIVVAVDN